MFRWRRRVIASLATAARGRRAAARTRKATRSTMTLEWNTDYTAPTPAQNDWQNARN